MAKNIDKIAKRLRAEVVCQVPDVGGGVFGMTRLAELASTSVRKVSPMQVAGHLLEQAVSRVAQESGERCGPHGEESPAGE